MFLRDLERAGALLAKLPGTLVGVGVTAFGRVVPSFFLRNYRAVVLRKTADLSLLRRRMEVFCLEEEAGTLQGLERLDSASLLGHPLTRAYLKGLPDPKILFLYQSYPSLEALAKAEGWILVGNPAHLRLRVGSRSFFEDLLRSKGLPTLRGGIYPLASLAQKGYQTWAAEMGGRFVLQLPDVSQGGGRGTFFIRNEADYRDTVLRLGEGIWRGCSLQRVSIHEYKAGASLSVVACITRRGLLVSGLQRQLVDLEILGDMAEQGVFCGHSWGERRWPSALQAEARRQAGALCSRLRQEGYRGILGIDFLLDPETETLYPLEINPRLTGALPVLSLLHLSEGIVPLEVPHLLEFSGVPFQVEEAGAHERYCAPLEGGHLLLLRGERKGGLRAGTLAPGRYRWDPEAGVFCSDGQGGGWEGWDREAAFTVMDGPPAGTEEPLGLDDPLFRLCRILVSDPPADDRGGLKREVQNAARWVLHQVLQ